MPALHPAVAATRVAVRGAFTDWAERTATSPGQGTARLNQQAQILVACSGGPDSVALAAAAAFEASRWPRRRGGGAAPAVGAVIVDHQWHANSADVARQAEHVCHQVGLAPVVVKRVDCRGPGGPEAAARSARYAALTAEADRLGAQMVLLGHTMQDQAETVLLGLLRGSGTRSLAGMAAVRDRFVRPLLGVSREQTVAACAAQGLAVWHDPANGDGRFARVRVRQGVLPVLIDELGPQVVPALARTAQLCREDAEFLDVCAAQVAAGAVRQKMGQVQVHVALVADVPAALRRRVLRAAAVQAGADDSVVAAVHVGAMDALVCDWHGQGPVSLPGGYMAVRVGAWVHIHACDQPCV